MAETQIDPDEQPNSVPNQVEVSVCVTTYNHAPYITQALDSILMQKTNFDFEILIGEDDSTDGTRNICYQYAERFPEKIRLFLRHEKDKIYVDGRKTGGFNGRRNCAAARGKYIALLEGDDFWIDPRKLQKQYDFMERHPKYVACGTRCLAWDAKGEEPAICFPRYHQGNFIRYDEIVAGGYFHTSTFFVRSVFFKRIPDWTTEVLQGDRAMLIEMAKPSSGLPVLTALTSVYRRSGLGIWTGTKLNIRRLHDESFFMKWKEYSRQMGDGRSEEFADRKLRFLAFQRKYEIKWPRSIFRFCRAVLFPRWAYLQVKLLFRARLAKIVS